VAVTCERQYHPVKEMARPTTHEATRYEMACGVHRSCPGALSAMSLSGSWLSRAMASIGAMLSTLVYCVGPHLVGIRVVVRAGLGARVGG
jgi:hypothetical protein